ncbi:MAG: GatB/YqeY domain-containing protein [Patescibacteria group bacterium]
MTLQQKIKEELKDAMRAKDIVRLNVIRGLLSAFTNELVAKKRKPNEILADGDAIPVINRAVKQHKDAIEQFEKGGRKDLADNEKDELIHLEKYLPAQMSEDELKPLIEAKIRELGVQDKAGVGKLLGVLMKDLKGKADGALVKKIIDGIIS